MATDELRASLTRAELTLQVRQTYYALQHREALRRLERRLTELYAVYYRTARLRVEVGEANPLEELNLSSTLANQQRLVRQAELAVDNLRRQLTTLLNAEDTVATADTLVQAALPPVLDTLAGGLTVALAGREVERRLADVSVTEALLRPGFRLGYSAQYFDEGGYLNGVEAGVRLPLFSAPTRRRIEAQRIGVDVARSQLEGERLRLDRERQSVRGQLRQAAVALDYYREQLVAINPEIVRVTRLNYRAGEIGYLELLAALRLLADNERAYLDTLLEYNRAVAQLKYLYNE